jgi:hypothetical protein
LAIFRKHQKLKFILLLRIKKASKYWKNFGQIEAKAECSPSNRKTAVIGKMTQMAMHHFCHQNKNQ